ncbi:hypothetical protein C2S52_023001 [Perilla frutescens var. hirtella]|nr:hypothetical protein C2S52_023001 [Perilla frutescens var. hirtella]
MAAAYAALISLFNNLELIQNHPRHSFHFEDKQIESLRQSVCFLIDFMQSCDYHGGNKEAAEELERRIASAAHAAEDVVESHVVDQIHSGSTLGQRKTCRFLLDLQKVIENMKFVSRKAMQVTKAHGGFKAEQPAHSVSSTPLISEKSDNTMVGFDDVSRQLLDLLTGEPSSRRVIPIIGMGGAGKTTLARNAFEHKLTTQHFDVRLWATISQQYSVKEILLQLLSGQSESESVYELGEQLHRILWGRRYLVVLDDMWSMEAWDEIQMYLPSNDNKTRIVLTTRQWNVADCFGSLCLGMNLLDKDESWNLFCEKAFAGKSCPSELEDIGKKIVEKCKGLPLAIVVVGGHLRKSSRMQEYWEKVANNFNSILDSGDENEQCLDILSLSYSYLPVQLKPCFIYMGTFEEDQTIRVSKLIQLWIAEGFIKSNNNSEEVAEDYLKDLIERNLIIVDFKDPGGKTFTCKIHDLLRELCLKIAAKEKFFHHVLSTPRAESRVLIVQDPKIIQAPISAPTVRSLKCQGAHQLSFELRLLRVQNRVSRASTNEVDVGFLERNLQHVNLRYLRCSIGYRAFKRYLPSSISRLWNLQTLIVEGVYEYVIAPYEIWEMPQLRHLKFNHIFLPDPHPCHSFDQPLDLQNLETVANLRLSEEVCKRIPNIKELRVKYYNFTRVCDEPKSHYSLHNLGRLQKLEILICSFSQGPEWRDLALDLTFPSSLKDLILTDPHLQWEELTMMLGFLPHLHSLYLEEVKAGPEWNLVDGGFPNLKSLYIRNCPNLIYWNADNSHFPVLKLLFLEDLSKLDNFPSGLGEIPTLEYISLEACSVSLAMSAMRMLVEQEEEQGNDDIRLVVNFYNDLEKQKSFEKQMEEEGLRSDHLLYSIFNM